MAFKAGLPLWARCFGLAALGLISACAAPVTDARLQGPSAGDLNRILAVPNPPRLIIANGQAATVSPRAAARMTETVLAEQRGARRMEIAAVPMLRSTGAGAQFMATNGHRALAQGEPAAFCPALTAATPGAASAVAAAEDALGRCATQLEARRGGRAEAAACGCRLIALDDALLAPIERFAFAPAVSALLIRNGDGTRLVAEAELQDGIEITRLRDATGEIGELHKDPGSETVSGTINGVSYSGERTIFGYRRGRLAERLTLRSAEGKAVSLLLGVEQRDAAR